MVYSYHTLSCWLLVSFFGTWCQWTSTDLSAPIPLGFPWSGAQEHRMEHRMSSWWELVLRSSIQPTRSSWHHPRRKTILFGLFLCIGLERITSPATDKTRRLSWVSLCNRIVGLCRRRHDVFLFRFLPFRFKNIKGAPCPSRTQCFVSNCTIRCKRASSWSLPSIRLPRMCIASKHLHHQCYRACQAQRERVPTSRIAPRGSDPAWHHQLSKFYFWPVPGRKERLGIYMYVFGLFSWVRTFLNVLGELLKRLYLMVCSPDRLEFPKMFNRWLLWNVRTFKKRLCQSEAIPESLEKIVTFYCSEEQSST